MSTHYRSGLYPAPLPSGLGSEGAGVVEEVGPGVSTFKPSDRVAYGNGPQGAYSETTIMPADRLVVLPNGISDQQGAAMMHKGMTVQYLIRQIRKVGKGDVILIHAAAGSVGLIACHWAKALGAAVISTVDSDDKAALARANGCDCPMVHTRETVVECVKDLTNGEKVGVVYDSIGKDTFLNSLDCLRPLGLMVCFGQASGSIGPVDLSIFVQKGSLFFTRPSLNTYAANRADLVAMAQDRPFR
jgi:NADPH2:quinone reductase